MIASVIGVMFFWLAIFLVQAGDGVTLAWRVSQEITVERFDSRIERYRENAIESEELRADLVLQIEAGDTLLDQELAGATRDADYWASRLVSVDDELAQEERTLEECGEEDDENGVGVVAAGVEEREDWCGQPERVLQ